MSINAAPPRLTRRALLAAGGLLAAPLPDTAEAFFHPAWSLKERFNCAADGRDEQARISDAILEAKAARRSLFAPAGIYGHGDVLDFGDVGIQGAGPGLTEFRALTPERGAIQISGDGARAESFRTTSPRASRRLQNDESAGLYAKDAARFLVRDVAAVGAASVGHMYRSCSHGVMDRIKARSTYADGIHMTGGCHGLKLQAPEVRDTGDDGVAIVSYVHDGRICQDIEVWGAQAYNSLRGVSVVGGRRIRHFAPRTWYTHYCAVYFLGEVSYDTYGLEEVVAYDADIYAPNQVYNSHCAMMVGGRDGTARTVDGETLSLAAVNCGFVRARVRGNASSRPRAGVAFDPGSERGFLKSSRISDFTNGDPPGIDIGGSDPLIEDVTVNNVGGSLLSVAPTAAGTITGDHLTAENVCQVGGLNRVLNFGGAPHLAGFRIDGLSIRGGNADKLLAYFNPVGANPDQVTAIKVRGSAEPLRGEARPAS